MKINLQHQSNFCETQKPSEMSWDYFLSRTALSKLSNIPIEDIKIKDHLFLDGYPKKLVSLSHTKEVAIAALCEESSARSIGVDIENKSRLVKKNYEKFFVNECDEFDSPLKLWGEKEAAYKALSPLCDLYLHLNKVLVLKDIWIKDNIFGLKGSENILGSLDYKISEQYQIITALITHK